MTTRALLVSIATLSLAAQPGAAQVARLPGRAGGSGVVIVPQVLGVTGPTPLGGRPSSSGLPGLSLVPALPAAMTPPLAPVAASILSQPAASRAVPLSGGAQAPAARLDERLSGAAQAVAPSLEALRARDLTGDAARETGSRAMDELLGAAASASPDALGGGDGTAPPGKGARPRPAVSRIAYGEGVSAAHRALFDGSLSLRKTEWFRGLARMGVKLDGPEAPVLTVVEASDEPPGGPPPRTRYGVEWKQGPGRGGAFTVTIGREDPRPRFSRLAGPDAASGVEADLAALRAHPGFRGYEVSQGVPGHPTPYMREPHVLVRMSHPRDVTSMPYGSVPTRAAGLLIVWEWDSEDGLAKLSMRLEPAPAEERDAPTRALERLLSRMPKAVLLDWDDTLADERPIVRAAHEELFRRFELPMPSHEELESQWRADHAMFYARFFPGIPTESVEDAWHEITERLRRGEEVGGRRVARAALFPGALEVLKALKALGVPLAVVSNKREEALSREIEAAGLSSYFKHVRGHKDGRLRKPSPQSIEATLKTLGVAPADAWYVGDQWSDMEAARGMARVLISREPAEASRESGARGDAAVGVVVIDALRSLLPLLEKLPGKRPASDGKGYLDSVLRRNTFRARGDEAITRGVQKYARLLGSRFTRRLLRADARDHVMDLGAGEGVFAAELAGERPIAGIGLDPKLRALKRRAAKSLPKVTAVSYKIKDREVEESRNFRPLKGRYLEDIPDDELRGEFGAVTLATDLWGVLAYTASPSVVLGKLHAILADKGELYLRVGPADFKAERSALSGRTKTPPSSLYATTVKTRNGRVLSFPDWLTTLPGFTVMKLEKGAVLLLRKDPRRRLRVPLLRLISVDRSRMPPGRAFVESD